MPRDDHSPRKTAPTGIALTLAAGAALLLGVGALVAAWPRDEVVMQGVVRSATLEPVASHRVSLDDCVRQSTMTDEHGAYAMPQRLPSRCRGQELKLVIEGYCGANRQVVVTTERGSVGLPLCEQKQEPITKVLPDEPPEVRPGTRSLNPERVVEGALRPSANSGLDERTRPGLARASRAVGRIRFGGNALSGGTTFLVSEGLVVTASYSRAGEEWNTGCVAFAEAATDRCIPVTGARTVSEHWGLAFLTLAGTPPGVESLPLAASFETSAPVGSVIAVIGFPEQDGRKPKELQDSLFDQLGVKWVQPGISFGVSPLRFLQRERDTLTHNAFTLGGNGGSAVVAAESAVVVAVHHSAQWESKTNQNLGFAIPTNKLYGDPAIRKLPLLWKTDPDKPAHLDVITKVP